MRCLNCGKESNELLCPDCISEHILDTVFNGLKHFNPETCGRYLKEYVETFDNPYEARNCILEILRLFDAEVSEYYYCRYYKMVRDERFEAAAIHYLDIHKIHDMKWQTVLYDLLAWYSRNEFVKPQEWCRYIKERDGLYCELYYSAAEFYAMIGEYEISEGILQKALAYCADDAYDRFLFYNREAERGSLDKLSKNIAGWRKKPYWPQKEDKRRVLAEIYDAKGIKYPRIKKKPDKVEESAFIPVSESVEKPDKVYCVFWCAEVFSQSAAKDIYQIAAVRIRSGVVSDEFQEYIRPWKATVAAKKFAAKEAEIDVETLNSAEDVDLVMEKFFAFVRNDDLVSTDALRSQESLITRAARYSGMKSIPNKFFDLLDYAADISEEFDMQNNTRKHLLAHFNIEEGKDALGKAKANMEIYRYLKELDKE